ncbi:MAG: squalene synthase HpnC [SAR202 cluster bacterium]|nr:squalene synthase HpnC [SAR202 cluster bacterium]
MASSTDRGIPSDLEPAYQECIRLARSHYENFTVAARFLSKEVLPHLSAIYAYCRGVDDLGDEAEGDRLALLDAWAADLELCYTGTPQAPHLQALQHTIRTFGIPPEPFRKLIEANRMDQLHVRHETFDDLLHYCERSANPVGQLYLYISGYNDDERLRLSDSTCTALQLANFWQDVYRDYAMGRIYLPQEDMTRFAYTEEELAGGICNDAFRTLMEFQVERTQHYFDQGLPLVKLVEGKARLHIKLFNLGGMRVLDAIRGQGYDVLSKRPVVGKYRKAWLLLKTYVGMKLTRQI